MYIEDSSLTVMFCDFEDNSASVHGGGIYMRYSSPRVQYCSFTGNHAGDLGGGIHCQFSDPDIYRCDFEDNIAGGDGGGMAIYYSSATVANCNFEYNGAPYLYGNGGGIYVSTSDTSTPSTIENSLFKGNYTRTNGGGIYVNSRYSALDIVNCTFWQNEANQRGAGVYCTRTASNVINCTFYDNHADYGGGAIYNIGSSSSRINMSVVNSIFWANGVSPIAGTRSPDVTFSDVEGGYGGTENINLNPRFINPAGGDFRLRGDSPCIDEGDNSHTLPPFTDFEGDYRILDGDGVEGPVVDMGVDEYDPNPILYFYLPFPWYY